MRLAWLLRSPSGEILLEEHAPAKAWGVVPGDFPLADNAICVLPALDIYSAGASAGLRYGAQP